jgi:hypothetical protein
MKERPIAKAVFVFFAGLPLAVFRLGYFVFTLPRRIRYRRALRDMPADYAVRMFGTQPLSLLSAVAEIGIVHDQEVAPLRKTRPGLLDLLEALWAEDEVAAWRLPTANEVLTHKSQFLEALCEAKTNGKPRVWAIDEDTRMFVIVDVNRSSTTFANPERLLDAFRGHAPESQEKAYAVGLRIERRSTIRQTPLP